MLITIKLKNIISKLIKNKPVLINLNDKIKENTKVVRLISRNITINKVKNLIILINSFTKIDKNL